MNIKNIKKMLFLAIFALIIFIPAKVDAEWLDNTRGIKRDVCADKYTIPGVGKVVVDANWNIKETKADYTVYFVGESASMYKFNGIDSKGTQLDTGYSSPNSPNPDSGYAVSVDNTKWGFSSSDTKNYDCPELYYWKGNDGQLDTYYFSFDRTIDSDAAKELNIDAHSTAKNKENPTTNTNINVVNGGTNTYTNPNIPTPKDTNTLDCNKLLTYVNNLEGSLSNWLHNYYYPIHNLVMNGIENGDTSFVNNISSGTYTFNNILKQAEVFEGQGLYLSDELKNQCVGTYNELKTLLANLKNYSNQYKSDTKNLLSSATRIMKEAENANDSETAQEYENIANTIANEINYYDDFGITIDGAWERYYAAIPTGNGAMDCDGILGPNVKEDIHEIMLWLRIAAPILVIVLGSLDFAKAVLSDDANALSKATGTFAKRLIAAVVLFFVPLLINFILDKADIAADFIINRCKL